MLHDQVLHLAPVGDFLAIFEDTDDRLVASQRLHWLRWVLCIFALVTELKVAYEASFPASRFSQWIVESLTANAT